ncbi:MAG TPA: 2OG-Fe(II) oxygenase family protein [Aliidongia sp.]|uniref:2OG-Fe(II) oxygenase family protein n=1 Tax=Aliidongia sp. TaxID=1914230 RepID=UPI002DDDBBDD|nr:2OG-Fe(II) oxygenase family protein [Aliidongia sp.]HEV2677511.1 2OG-Fe(II) oxygenase family protein [Aliidongia sp.]
MARLDIAVKGLFATPVAAVEMPGADRLNPQLVEAILRRRAEARSVQASNAGGWHSDREILTWGGEPVRQIIEIAKGVATRLSADRDGKPIQPAWTVQAWANVNGPGDSNICHYHPGSVWSGTYYVEDGGCASDPSLGGEFEMLDPRGPGPGMYAPTLKFAGEDGASVGSAETIQPRPGLLFIFPSWLYHQVRPYRGTALRISIAFNFGL